MSGISEPGEGVQAYFRAIEERFVALRGAPLLLSPKDWQISKVWYEDGIPLAVVLEALEEVFEKRAARGATGRVSSLGYCRAAVEKGWAARQELVAPGVGRSNDEGGEGPSTADRLRALAEALSSDLPDRAAWSDRIRSLEGDPATVDRRLRELEDELHGTVEAALGDEERAEIEKAVEAAMSRAGSRLPEAERPALRASLRRRQLAKHAGIPSLTVL